MKTVQVVEAVSNTAAAMKDHFKREGGKIAVRTALAGLAVAFGTDIMGRDASTVEAAAFTYAAYAPNRSGGTLTGWANLSRDCSNTYGCWNYMKIEERNPRRWETWEPWLYVGRQWVNNNGWNHVTVNMPNGCGEYRTTVDSYNIVTGDQGGGANLGPVGVSGNGTTIYEFRTRWSSGTNSFCNTL